MQAHSDKTSPQLSPRLKPLATYVERPEADSSPTLPIQSDKA